MVLIRFPDEGGAFLDDFFCIISSYFLSQEEEKMIILKKLHCLKLILISVFQRSPCDFILTRCIASPVLNYHEDNASLCDSLLV